MRYIYIILLIFSALFTSAQNEITLKSRMPYSVKQGDSFTIELIIDKPDFSSYASFSQEFPKGFSVVENYSAGAEFKFINQELSFVWLRLPKQKRIILTYDVKTDIGLKGICKFTGRLKYLAGNRTGNVYLDTISVNIESEQVSQINKKIKEGNTLKGVSCKRKGMLYDKKNKAYIVTLEVVKQPGDISTTRITEVIPWGFKAFLESSKGANFNISNNQIVFLWSNIPADNIFTVSYRLVHDSNIQSKPEINGYIEYIKEGIIIKEDIVK